MKPGIRDPPEGDGSQEQYFKSGCAAIVQEMPTNCRKMGRIQKSARQMNGLLHVRDMATLPGSTRGGPSTGPGSDPAAALAALLAALGFALALVWAALHRGPWYDEFYSWFVTRPDREFAAAMRESWLADNHPPLFYMLSWLGGHEAPSIETLRLVNLAGLLALLGGGWVMLRPASPLRPAAAVALLLIAANSVVLVTGTELRSYFLSMCFGGLAVLGMAQAWIAGGLERPGQRIVFTLSMVAAFNLHILTSVIVGALAVPFLLMALWRKRYGLFRQILLACLVGGTLFVVVSAIQLPMWESNTARFWIPAGLMAARWAIQTCIERTAEANLAILIGGVAGAVLLARQALRSRTLPPALELQAMLVAGVVLACALLVGLQLLRPVLMERYLAALIPPIALGVALGFDALRRALPRAAGVILIGLALLLSLRALQHNAEAAAARKSWIGTGERIAALVRACPDSPVHIDPAGWNADAMAAPPHDNRVVFPQAYRLVAQRFGFALEPQESRRLSHGCPNLFWAEHDTIAAWNEANILAHLRRQGFAVQRVWQYRIGDGWIAADRPLDLPRAAH